MSTDLARRTLFQCGAALTAASFVSSPALAQSPRRANADRLYEHYSRAV